MTANQLRYWELQEAKRSNLAKEQETSRSNVAKEQETQRHNLETEEVERYKLIIGNKGVVGGIADFMKLV